jgi:hypothetical protein
MMKIAYPVLLQPNSMETARPESRRCLRRIFFLARHSRNNGPAEKLNALLPIFALPARAAHSLGAFRSTLPAESYTRITASCERLRCSAYPIAFADGIRLGIPQTTEWQRIGDEIKAATIFERSHFVDVRKRVQ